MTAITYNASIHLPARKNVRRNPLPALRAAAVAVAGGFAFAGSMLAILAAFFVLG